MFALLLLAQAPLLDIHKIITRYNAELAFDKCVHAFANALVAQHETSEVIADVALASCNRQREAFIAASEATMPDAAQLNEWVKKSTESIRENVIWGIVIVRSNIPLDRMLSDPGYLPAPAQGHP